MLAANATPCAACKPGPEDCPVYKRCAVPGGRRAPDIGRCIPMPVCGGAPPREPGLLNDITSVCVRSKLKPPEGLKRVTQASQTSSCDTLQNSNTAPHTFDRRASFCQGRKLGVPGGQTDASRTSAEQEEEEELCEEDKHADKVAWANVVRKGFGESHLEKAPRFAWLE